MPNEQWHEHIVMTDTLVEMLRELDRSVRTLMLVANTPENYAEYVKCLCLVYSASTGQNPTARQICEISDIPYNPEEWKGETGT